jgi:alpha-galactosidase
MDILEVGNLGNGNFDQEVTHFSYWAALKSPLLIGTPLTTISKRSLEVLKNQEIIALNQDNLGIAPWYLPKISVEGQSQYWAGPLEQGWVILLTNDLADKPQDLSIRWSDVAELPQRKSWRVRDLWAHKDLGSFEVGVSFKNVPPHGTKVIRLT